MDGVEKDIKQAEERLRKADEQLCDLEQYKRNVQRAQSLYENLQNLLQSVDVNKNLDQERVSILTAPSMSLPANTRALLKLGIALLGGLGLGFGLIYCLERMGRPLYFSDRTHRAIPGRDCRSDPSNQHRQFKAPIGNA